MRLPLLFLTLTLTSATLVGCKGEPAAEPTPGQPKPVATSQSGLKKLEIIDVKVGTGEPAKNGDMVYMTYTGKLLSNGKQFDSNDKGDANPYNFVLGSKMVIAGWDEGLVGIRKGGRRTLKIPATLGYGAEGSGELIPPNSDLIFDVQCLDIVPPGDEARAFEKKDLKIGTGPAAKMGDIITVHYKGTLVNGKPFDSTYDRKKPVQFELGTSAAPGFDAGVVGMKKGGKRWLRIPPAIGYGAMGKMPTIPGDSVLIFEVELVKIG